MPVESFPEPESEAEVMRRYGFDPDNATDQQKWLRTTPASYTPVDYSRDAFEFGGRGRSQQAGTAVTRGSGGQPASEVPGAVLSPENSRQLAEDLAEIRQAETGPGRYL